MGTEGQEGSCQGPPGAGPEAPAPPGPGAVACTIQAARGAQRVQHLLAPLGEAVLGPGDALQQLQQLLFLLRLFAHGPTRQVAVRVTVWTGGNASQEMSGHLPRPSNPGPRPDGACRPRHPPERGAAPAVLQTQAAGQAPAALEGVLPEPRAAAAAPALVGPAPQRPSLRHPLVQRGRAQAPKLLQMARIRAAPIRGHTLEQLSGEAHRGGPVGRGEGRPEEKRFRVRYGPGLRLKSRG